MTDSTDLTLARHTRIAWVTMAVLLTSLILFSFSTIFEVGPPLPELAARLASYYLGVALGVFSGKTLMDYWDRRSTRSQEKPTKF